MKIQCEKEKTEPKKVRKLSKMSQLLGKTIGMVLALNIYVDNNSKGGIM
jgi:hypothetical protein